MRQRLIIAMAVLAFAGLVGTWGGIASAKGSGPKSKELQNLEYKTTSFNSADSGSLFTTDIFSSGKKVGTNQSVCFKTGPGPSSECIAINHFNKGDVIIAGTGGGGAQGSMETLAIIGGTGAYGTARGTVDVRFPNANPTDWFQDFHVAK
jgi:hypothetical protein